MKTTATKPDVQRAALLTRERIVFYSRTILICQLAVIGAWAVACWFLRIRYVLPLGIDFRVFWGASLVSLSHGPLAAFDPHLLYAAEKAAFSTSSIDIKFAPWVYPPTFQLLIYPLALIAYPVAYGLFACLSITMCLAACAPAMKDRPLPWITVIAFPGIWVAVFQGQNSLITFALAASAVCLLRTRPALAGVCAGLLVMKPQLAPVFPLMFLLGGHYRALLAAVLTVLAMCSVSTLVFGFPIWTAFLSALSHFNAATLTRGEDHIWQAMPTIFAFLRRMGASVQTAYVVHFGVALIGLAASIRLWIKHPCHEMSAAAAMVIALMLPPYLVYYDLAWLLLPIILLCGSFRNGEERVIAARVVVALAWAVPIFALLTVFWFHIEQWGTFLLPALLLMILRRSSGSPSKFRHDMPAFPGLEARYALLGPEDGAVIPENQPDSIRAAANRRSYLSREK